MQSMHYNKSRPRLTASPNFALGYAADGSPFVTGEVEPYSQYWLSVREHMLLAMFGQKGGMQVERAIKQMLVLRPKAQPAAERRRLERDIAEMVEAGVLIEPSGELSRYGKAMARDYLDHRPFPLQLVDHIAATSGLAPQSRVLDLASGPGSLALALARRTPHVTIMELSRGFVSAAAEEADRLGLALETINESCNRLDQHDGQFDVVTVSQALHWLDDIAVCKGVCRVLAEGGSFFVIHASMNLPDDHPLAWILGDRTPLGDKAPTPFAQVAGHLYRRLSLLFAALDASHVERHGARHVQAGLPPVQGDGMALFNQSRPIGEGFARAFLSDAHIASTGLAPEKVWSRIAADCRGVDETGLQGSMDWAVLHFRRGACGFELELQEPDAVRTIAYP